MHFLHQQSSSTQAHQSIPSTQREMFLLAASHLIATSVHLKILEESRQDNRKPAWKPAEGKGNQHCHEFCLISLH